MQIDIPKMSNFRMDFLKYAITNMKHRSLRSWLTIIGIIVGIGSILVLVSIAQGLNDSVNEELKAFGSNTIIVIPGGQISVQSAFSTANYKPPSTGKLYSNDVARLARVEGIEYISKVIQVRPDVEFRKDSVSASVNGIEPSVFKQTQLLEVEKGRMLVDSDRQAAVIGKKIAYDTFDEDVELGSLLKIGAEQKTFRVVGVLKSGGSGAGGGVDSAIYIPVEDARELAGESILPNEVSAIRITAHKDANMQEVKDQIEAELLSAHKVKADEKDFSLITSDYISQQIGVITGMLTLFLGGVAFISLIVGGIGIANTMFMAVMERTHEIGVLKAVGGSRGAITEIFLIESGLIGAIGGGLGIIFGTLIALILSYFGVPTTVSPLLVMFCFVFSVSVGVASGYFPAKRAAKMNAVDALRGE